MYLGKNKLKIMETSIFVGTVGRVHTINKYIQNETIIQRVLYSLENTNLLFRYL